MVGECNNYIGSASLVLIFEEQFYNISLNNNEVEKEERAGGGGIGCTGTLLLQGLSILIGIFLACYLSYVIYSIFFNGEGTWAYYAMFFTAIVSTIATNIYARISYLKTQNKKDYSDNILGNGMGFFCTINAVLSYIIYIIEMIVTSKFNFWHTFLGVIVSIVNIAIFALPFIVLELIVL